ncbi:MAG: hypothetical protein C5B59_16860 [Bacteroidetes bacterium]|nr:MAG: hypothetical protein C5B59_16860 [Bacteroidota bacterium]
MSRTFFSIIIPTYNSEKTLQKALSSVMSQTFPDFEILILDNLSADSTVSVIKQNQEKDLRIRLISEKDKGIYYAMNKGISLAQGEWLYFLGSDDQLYDSSVLQKISDELNTTGCRIIYGNILGRRGKYDGPFDFDKLLENNISHQAMFFHREVFERVGVFNTKYRTHADWDFNLRCFEAGLETFYVDMIVAEFASGGASSKHEVGFMREALIEKKLKRLNETGSRQLRAIANFDRWWRYIRNVKIRGNKDMEAYAKGIEIPPVIRNVISLQSSIPEKALQMGMVSKTMMMISYFQNLFIGAI